MQDCNQEFNFIDKFFKNFSSQSNSNQVKVYQSIGDDAAILAVKDKIVISSDSLVSGVHFFANTDPYLVGWRALAVNLSDMAAMGATPFGFSLNLHLPQEMQNEAWVGGFVKGMQDLTKELQINLQLLGGDTTAAKELAISITIYGDLASNKSGLLRSAAKEGEDMYLTASEDKSIGDAYLGLLLKQKSGLIENLSLQSQNKIMLAFDKPYPKVKFATSLMQNNYSNCALDISDGVLQDLSHILDASNLEAEIFLEEGAIASVSMCEFFRANNIPLKQRMDYFCYGDDYELLFTSSADEAGLQKLAGEFGLKLIKIGKLTNNNSPDKINVKYSNKAQEITFSELEIRNLLKKSFKHF